MNTPNPTLQEFPSAAEPSPQHETQTVAAGSKTMERGGYPTPGPYFPVQNSAGTWEVKISTNPFGQSVATVGVGCPEYFPGDQEANARLLAGSWELLAALRPLAGLLPTLFDALDLDLSTGIKIKRSDDDAELYGTTLAELLGNASKAVATATGKEIA